jgi:hypothetical protein
MENTIIVEFVVAGTLIFEIEYEKIKDKFAVDLFKGNLDTNRIECRVSGKYDDIFNLLKDYLLYEGTETDFIKDKSNEKQLIFLLTIAIHLRLDKLRDFVLKKIYSLNSSSSI